MTRQALLLFPLGFAAAAMAVSAADIKWPIHDRTRPMARVVTPGTASTPEQPGKAPSDAIVLFDGKDLSKWESREGRGPAGWKVENGYFEVVKGSGGIRTKDGFGDVPAPRGVDGPEAAGGRRTRIAATAASSSWASTRCRSSTATRARPTPTARPRPSTASTRLS